MMMQDDNDDSYVSTPVYSDDCPTQLVTSGDDTVVKFWDAREAMGSTSPLHGGRSTLCPFSGPMGETSDMSSNTHAWEQRANQGYVLPGMVTPLATLQTGHRGNVFHVTPISSQPGKVLTSGADGYVRLSDVQHQSISSSSSQNSSTVVMSPEFNPEDPSLNQHNQSLRSLFASRRGSMCFSHHFIDQHTGLVCSERGLRRFDLRLAPREQMYSSLLTDKESVCKSCAIWSASSSSVDRFSDADSVYFFGTSYCSYCFDA
jgi:WD40 repeat protein